MSEACEFAFFPGALEGALVCSVHPEESGRGRARICDIGLAELRATVEEQQRVIAHLRDLLEGSEDATLQKDCPLCKQALSPEKEA